MPYEVEPRTITLRALLTAWLVAMAWVDLRRRELPHWGTTFPLIAAVGYCTVAAAWRWLASGWSARVADGLTITLAFLTLLLSDGWPALAPAAGTLALAFAAAGEAGRVVAVGWLLAIGLDKAGIIGHGDTKLVVLLISLFPAPAMGVALLGAVLLFGLVTLVRRAGMATPLWLLSLAGKIARGRLPATGELAQVHAPLAPPLACGALVYLWPLWLLGVG